MGVRDIWAKGALAEELDALSLDMAGVSDKIGDTTDTAADAPTSLFSGIKRILQWFTGTWTAARAAKVDVIDTNVTAVKTAVDGVQTDVGEMLNAVSGYNSWISNRSNSSMAPPSGVNWLNIVNKTGRGKGHVFFTASSGLKIKINIDGFERTVKSDLFPTDANGSLIDVEYMKKLNIDIQATGSSQTSIAFSYFLQIAD